MEHRQAMRFAAQHAIDRRHLTNAVGGGEDRRTADAGVAIGGVGGMSSLAQATQERPSTCSAASLMAKA